MGAIITPIDPVLAQYGFYKGGDNEHVYKDGIKYHPADVAAYIKANPLQEGVDNAALVDANAFKSDPDKAYGALMRSQYDDYLKRFVDSENALFNTTSYMNPGLTMSEINKATGSGGYVNTALQANQQRQDRDYQRYGATLTAEGQQALSSQRNITNSTAVVDAANRIRQRIIDRDRAVAIGSSALAGATAQRSSVMGE